MVRIEDQDFIRKYSDLLQKKFGYVGDTLVNALNGLLPSQILMDAVSKMMLRITGVESSWDGEGIVHFSNDLNVHDPCIEGTGYYPKISHMQLFDLENDPDEMRNLVDEPSQADRVKGLLALMKTWQARVGDTLPLPSQNISPETIDLTGRERTPDQWQPEWIRTKYF